MVPFLSQNTSWLCSRFRNIHSPKTIFLVISLLALAACGTHGPQTNARPPFTIDAARFETEGSELPDSRYASTAGDDEAPPDETSPSALSSYGNVPNPVLDKALDLCQVAQNYWHKGELDNALQTLDEAYASILEVDTTHNPKLFQQKEDLRFLISKRILEIYASRHVVANGSHKEIPLTMNKHVQMEIDLFTKNKLLRDFFIASYGRSGRYRPYIVKQLKAAGMPESLSWLPLIESGFKTGALSKARALGLWQFIPSTGYKFGLNRDTYVDERMDPIKATDAAIAYLKELHQIFGDWTTVLAAYNCGEGRVLQIIRTQNVNYLDNFWDLYERLPAETARYVPQFLATLHIIGNLKKYGMDGLTTEPEMTFETIEVARSVSLGQVASFAKLNAVDLIQLNPELRLKQLPPDPYRLRIPVGAQEMVLAGINKLPVSRPPTSPKTIAYHKIQRGQTLFSIALKYGTTVRAITRANNLNKRSMLVAGTVLKIPVRGSMALRESSSPPVVCRAANHTVRSGDSLWNIAKQYGTTTQAIKKLNQLPDTGLTVGQVLKIPGVPKTTSRRNTAKVYHVKPGDSAFTIATRHNMSLSQFLSRNKLAAHSKIYPGQQLFVD
ncbi:MAG: LysM peptidoglycan-binding domain-containing protein [Thermodesulfobacteriota bacterium]